MITLTGKEIKPLLEEEIKEKLKSKKTSFYLYSDRDDFPSQAYLRGIKKNLDKFEIPYLEGYIDHSLSKEKNLESFVKNSKEKSILLARPLKCDYENEYINTIYPCYDPDMLTDVNRGKLFHGDLTYLTATSQSVKRILDFYKIDVVSKKAVILGRSVEVGYPCFQLLNKMNAACTLLHSRVDKKIISDYVKDADIIILATGKTGLISKDDLNENQVIIDCGFNPNGGDLGFVPNVNAYTPVPGGVGSLTSLTLILNAINLK